MAMTPSKTSRALYPCDYCCSTFGSWANVARHVQTSHPNESRLVGMGFALPAPVNLVFGSFNAMAGAPGPALLPQASGPTTTALTGPPSALVTNSDVEMAAAALKTVATAAAVVAAPSQAMSALAPVTAPDASTAVSHVCIPGVDRPFEDTDDDSDGDGTNATVCSASHTDDMLGDGTDDNEVYDVSDLNGAIQDMEDEAANALAPPDIVSSSAAARIRAYYEALPEASAAQLVVDPVWATRPSRFSCPALRFALRFALTAGGSGLTERDQVRYANSLRLIEMDATRGTTVRGPIVRTFSSPRSFLTATRHEVIRVLALRKWQRVHISIRNRTYVHYFRDVLQAGLDALGAAKEVFFGDCAAMLELDLNADDTSRTRHGTLDSDLYQSEAHHVRRLHGVEARDMGVQLHADEAVVSWSGENYMFPIRANFVNVLDNRGTWVTVGYVQHIAKAVEKTAAARLAVSDARNELFQRSLAMSLACLIRASESGVTATVGTRGSLRLVPRIVGLVVDQVEERNFLALMGNSCRVFFSLFMEDRRMSGARMGLRAIDREMVPTLDAQLAATLVRVRDPRPSRRRALGAEHSALAFVPALGAVHGLGTGASSLYRIFSSNLLHVWKLGILRMLAQRLPAVFQSLCQGRGGARFGSVSDTLNAINLRGWHHGRNFKITPASPGYVC